MIGEDRAEAAVEYLRDTAKQYGQARGHARYCEEGLRRVKALNMPAEGSVADRERAAYASEAYLAALTDMENAIAEFETIRAMREAAVYTIEVFRSENSARKQGVNL
jgi:hypothetical protein